MNFSRAKIHLGHEIFLDIVARYGVKIMWEFFGDLWSYLIWVASQYSNAMNIPFNEKKRIYVIKE